MEREFREPEARYWKSGLYITLDNFIILIETSYKIEGKLPDMSSGRTEGITEGRRTAKKEIRYRGIKVCINQPLSCGCFIERGRGL